MKKEDLIAMGLTEEQANVHTEIHDRKEEMSPDAERKHCPKKGPEVCHPVYYRRDL